MYIYLCEVMNQLLDCQGQLIFPKKSILAFDSIVDGFPKMNWIASGWINKIVLCVCALWFMILWLHLIWFSCMLWFNCWGFLSDRCVTCDWMKKSVLFWLLVSIMHKHLLWIDREERNMIKERWVICKVFMGFVTGNEVFLKICNKVWWAFAWFNYFTCFG